jgi:hypothetical protein
MSVLMRDLLLRGSANMPDADGATTGGAVSFSKKVSFVDITPTGTVDYISSSASDTGTVITIFGRDGTGTIISEAKTLTGTAFVIGSAQFERLMKGLMTGTVAVGDVAAVAHTAILSARTAQGASNGTGVTDASITLQSGDGASCAIGDIIRINGTQGGAQNQLREIIALSGDIAYLSADWRSPGLPTGSTTYSVYQGMIFNLSYGTGASDTNYQVTEIRRPFYNAASDVSGGSTRNYYEKLFAINVNTVTALTVVTLVKQADPSAGTLNFALNNGGTGATQGLNGTDVVANRQTAPTVVTAFSSGAAPQTISTPNSNNSLPNGASPNSAGAQGVWLQLQLAAGLAPTKTSFTQRIAGQTT